MTTTTHLCLVSKQATPNLTPALDPATAPQRVILLVSPDMAAQAAWLEAVLQPRGIRCERWPIADPWDLEGLQLRLLELLEALAGQGQLDGLVLNATGGTKPMSIAAVDAFRAYDRPIFYVHPERDRLIWLHPARRPAVELANRLGLEDFLAAHGTSLLSRTDTAVPEELQQLTDWLIDQNARVARPLGALNRLASQARGPLQTQPLERRDLDDRELSALVQRFALAGLIRIDRDRLSFPDEAARSYVNGGWLEAHVYASLRQLRSTLPAIQDLARAIDISRATARGDAVPNELDVACLADNRLYIVECKTRNWGQDKPGRRGPKPSIASGPGSEALYRLDTLADLLGGLQARAMLISYIDLPAHVRRRAADLRIGVCAGSRLPELPAVLRQWLSG